MMDSNKSSVSYESNFIRIFALNGENLNPKASGMATPY
jgi:hypothetical protein